MNKGQKLSLLTEQGLNSLLYFFLPILFLNQFNNDSAALYYVANNAALYIIIVVRIFFFQSFSYFGEQNLKVYLDNLDAIVSYFGIVAVIALSYLILFTELETKGSEIVWIIVLLVISDLERVSLLARSQASLVCTTTLIAFLILGAFQFYDTLKISKIETFTAILSPYLSLFAIRLSKALWSKKITIKQLPFSFSSLSVINNLLQIINISLTLWWLGSVFGTSMIVAYGFLRQCTRIFSPFQQFLNLIYMKKFANGSSDQLFRFGYYMIETVLYLVVFFSVLLIIVPFLIPELNISVLLLFIISFDAALLMSITRYTKFIQSRKINVHTIRGSLIYTAIYWLSLATCFGKFEIISLVVTAALTARIGNVWYIINFYKRTVKA